MSSVVGREGGRTSGYSVPLGALGQRGEERNGHSQVRNGPLITIRRVATALASGPTQEIFAHYSLNRRASGRSWQRP